MFSFATHHPLTSTANSMTPIRILKSVLLLTTLALSVTSATAAKPKSESDSSASKQRREDVFYDSVQDVKDTLTGMQNDLGLDEETLRKAASIAQSSEAFNSKGSEKAEEQQRKAKIQKTLKERDLYMRHPLSRGIEAGLTWAGYTGLGSLGKKVLPEKLTNNTLYRAGHLLGPLYMGGRAYVRSAPRSRLEYKPSGLQQTAQGMGATADGFIDDTNDAFRFAHSFVRGEEVPTQYELARRLKEELLKQEDKFVLGPLARMRHQSAAERLRERQRMQAQAEDAAN